MQGFASAKVEATVLENGELDTVATVAAAFGASVSGDGSGVLVFADDRYLACVRDGAGSAVDSTFKIRDVLGGSERIASEADLADYIARFESYRITRS